MKRILLAVALSAPIALNIVAMEKSTGEKGREMMKAVYDRLTTSINGGNFSEADLQAYLTFPTQSGRDILTKGEKPGHISEGMKVQGLIDFFNLNNGEFATKAVALLKVLKDKLAANPEAVSVDELKKGAALASLIHTLLEAKGKLRNAPALTGENEMRAYELFNETLRGEITRRAQAPIKQAAVEKKQREEQEWAEKIRSERAAEAQAKEEAKAAAERKRVESRQQALAALQTPAGQKIVTAARARIEPIREKIAAGTIDPKDVRAYLEYYREGEKAGTVSEQDYFIKRHALVSFFNNNEANTQLIDRVNALLALPQLNTQQNRALFALKILLGELVESSFGTETPLTNMDTIRTLDRQAEKKARTVIQ